ncbi:MAG: PH domain-containing protein [Archaeoglobaceae archaeon]|nr:PH domain-containing protein [Archaeoglobaceae archaeon]MDW8128471.1 PH domain-containing protein [Archaeoglobaceae archaeon]
MLIYEDKPKYDFWGKLVLSFAPSLMLTLIILLESNLLPTESDEEAMLAKEVLLVSIVVIIVVYWALLPRKFEIHEDKFKIVLGIFSYTIPLEEILEIRKVETWKAFLYKGPRFTTSVKNLVEIRKKRSSVLISPQNPDMLIENFKRATKNAKKTKLP